jgi:DNA-binding transcriptional regulator YdaS (Cro superfamily)
VSWYSIRCDAIRRQELRQDVLWEIRLALVEVAGQQLHRQQAAPFQLVQERQQP